MGTNYYLHLGKRSSIGEHRCSFTWATAPPNLTASATVSSATVQDEYGREMSLSEFLTLIADDEQRHNRIGERFS